MGYVTCGNGSLAFYSSPRVMDEDSTTSPKKHFSFRRSLTVHITINNSSVCLLLSNYSICRCYINIATNFSLWSCFLKHRIIILFPCYHVGNFLIREYICCECIHNYSQSILMEKVLPLGKLCPFRSWIQFN